MFLTIELEHQLVKELTKLMGWFIPNRALNEIGVTN